MAAFHRWLGAAALSVAGVLGTSVQAGDHPVVVELYTSQGCSSCPPADAYFGEKLVGRDDVIALALHVDYWDYIGWKDDFADPAFAERQRNYARAAQKRSVYTPQMVIGGVSHVVGNRPADVRSELSKNAGQGTHIDLAISRKGDTLTVMLDNQTSERDQLVVQLVRYSAKETRDIKRGENAGRTLDYHNIVTEWKTIGEWNARRSKTLNTRVKGDAPIVVIVQRKGFGPILAAAELN